jgi:hypothetical protein
MLLSKLNEPDVKTTAIRRPHSKTAHKKPAPKS